MGLFSIEAHQLFRLAVVRLQIVVTDRPIARVSLDIIVWIARQRRPIGVKRLQSEIERGIPQRDSPIMLSTSSDYLSRISLDRLPIRSVGRLIDVRFIVEIRFNVTREK